MATTIINKLENKDGADENICDHSDQATNKYLLSAYKISSRVIQVHHKQLTQQVYLPLIK